MLSTRLSKDREFWKKKNSSIHKDAKGRRDHFHKVCCTEFSQLPLLVLGDEDVTLLRAQEHVVHVESPLLLPGEEGRAKHRLGPDAFQGPSAKIILPPEWPIFGDIFWFPSVSWAVWSPWSRQLSQHPEEFLKISLKETMKEPGAGMRTCVNAVASLTALDAPLVEAQASWRGSIHVLK